MTPTLVSLLVILLAVHDIRSQDPPGYSLLYTSNPREYSNVPMHFTGKCPSWLNGSLIRVGPALFELGNPIKSSVGNTLDGFAKVALWKFQNSQTVLFSTKFLNTTYYAESLANQKFTSNIFLAPTNPKLTPSEVERSLQVGIDNMDISIVNFTDTTNTTIVATNDIWSVYELSLTDLSTVRKVTPEVVGVPQSVSEDTPVFIKQLSTSHPLPEPNNPSNEINIIQQAALNPNEQNILKVVRIKSLQHTEVIASFQIPEVTFLHSFSLTQTKVAILTNPYVLNVTCLLKNEGHCYYWKTGFDPVTLYIVDLHTGDVKNFQVPKIFVYHHINAYDESQDQLVVDVVAYTGPVPLTKLNLPDLKSPIKRSQIDSRPDMKRIRVFLSNNTATLFSMESTSEISRIASTLDYPVINECNRSKPYCYVYGIVERLDNKNIGFMGLAKKDICAKDRYGGDALFKVDYVFPHEPTFVPNPSSLTEDDGVILVPLTYGYENRTNLAILNATGLLPIDEAPGPDFIPQSQHGGYFEV